MTQKAIKTELLLLDRGGGRGGERGGRIKGFRRKEGGREGEKEMEFGIDENQNFKTTAYVILLIKASDVSGTFVHIICVCFHAYLCVCMCECAHLCVCMHIIQ